MTQILFVDIDGPLVPARALFLPGNGYRRWGWNFDPCAVGMLNFLAWAVPDLRMVLASHRWGERCIASPYPKYENLDSQAFWIEVMNNNGMKMKFHEDWLTPRTVENGEYIKETKAVEIERWILQHPDVKRWATIEDSLNGGDLVTKAMQTHFGLFADNYDKGLTWEDFKRMCNRFGLKSSQLNNKYEEFTKHVLL